MTYTVLVETFNHTQSISQAIHCCTCAMCVWRVVLRACVKKTSMSVSTA